MPDRCVAYNCKSGYDSDRNHRKANGLPQLTQFRAPPGMLEKWEAAISRGGNFKMKPSHTVCELHFDDSFIIKPKPLLVGGIDISLHGGKKSLAPNAIPTILEGYPKYLIPKLPSKRSCSVPRKKSDLPSKKIKLNETQDNVEEISSNECEDAIPLQEEEEIVAINPLPLLEAIYADPSLVSKPDSWLIHRGPTFVSLVHIDPSGIQIDKAVKFVTGEKQPSIFFHGYKILAEEKVHTLEDVSSILKRVDSISSLCPGTGLQNVRSKECFLFLEPSGSKNKPPPRCAACATKRRDVAKSIRRNLRKTAAKRKRNQQKNVTVKIFKRQVACRDKKIISLKQSIRVLHDKFQNLERKKIDDYVATMPQSWQSAILTCVEAAKAKNSHGRRYTAQWIYECALLRIKSLALYKKMLRDNFLPLPSLRTLQRYMRKLRPAYGFNENTFSLIKEKTVHIPEPQRHGSLLLDEIKLSEGLSFDKPSLQIKGFVDYGRHTPDALRDVPADHALVLMFQGFQEAFYITIAAFLSKGAIKGPDLAKIILEATGLLEESGMFVDCIVSDAASWNRNMWSKFGLKKSQYEKEGSRKSYQVDDDDNDDWSEIDDPAPLAFATQKQIAARSKKKAPRKKKRIQKSMESSTDDEELLSSCTHPVDNQRRLYFASDFPHLIKSVKQRIVNAEELETPDGKVKLNHWAIVCQEDEKRGIKVAPKLSKAHFQSETYAAMSVKLAFSFFSEQVATAMEHYKTLGISGMEDCASTVQFIRRINVVIDYMNSNTKKDGLKGTNIQEESLQSVPPVCVVCQKVHALYSPQRRGTAREALTDFLEYLKRWETSGVKRDKRLTACAAFGLRPPKGSNVTGGDMLRSLLSMPDVTAEQNKQKRLDLEKSLDEALDAGEVIDSCPFSDHDYYKNSTIDISALKHFGGYVVRRTRRFTCAKSCDQCFESLRAPADYQFREEEDNIIHSRSLGYLITPSDEVMTILETLERTVLEVFQTRHLHKDLFVEVMDQVKQKSFKQIGCEEHKRDITKAVISFYINTRLIFACEEYNRRLSVNAHKKVKAKQQQKMFRLTC
ncbi:DNA transposase [Frankliniella fusca]|uniref:DNA transposase n=1 Tax=Frankliniella fusca TaxID=407009 RepID=A0AAE1HCH1_9NEOP|nr:DNA transposase [Frankliniella fusca]